MLQQLPDVHCMAGCLVDPNSCAWPVDRPPVFAYQPFDCRAITWHDGAAYRSPLTKIELPDAKSPMLYDGVDDFGRIDVPVEVPTPGHQVDDELSFRDADDLRMSTDHGSQHR